jgi:thioesterase domain-containing protein
LRFLEQALERGWSWPAQLPTLSVRQIYAAARDRYRPGIARIHEVLLLKATQGHGGDEPATELTDDPLLGWEAYVDGKLEATEVRGGHSSMLQEPFVYEVALVMQRCLDPEFVTQPKPAPLSTRPDVDRDAAPQTLRIPSNPPVL